MSRKRSADMSFLDHLEELRGVLFRVVIIALVGMIACFIFAARIQDLLTLPFDRAAARIGLAAGQLALLAPTEGFIVHVKIALFTGLMIGSPLIFWQIWRFVSPGLYPTEKRFAFPIVASASLCFLGGAAFGFNILSFATEFFLKFATADIANQWSLTKYIGFVTRLVFAFGLVFELPLVIFILSRMGLVTPQTLSAYRRHAVLGILVLAAILTPPDPISQAMLAGPVYLLFEISILISRIVYRRRKRSSGDEEDGSPPDDPGPANDRDPSPGGGGDAQAAPAKEEQQAPGSGTGPAPPKDDAGARAMNSDLDPAASQHAQNDRAASDLAAAAAEALRRAQKPQAEAGDTGSAGTDPDDPITPGHGADGEAAMPDADRSSGPDGQVDAANPAETSGEKPAPEGELPDGPPSRRRRPRRDLDLFEDEDEWGMD